MSTNSLNMKYIIPFSFVLLISILFTSTVSAQNINYQTRATHFSADSYEDVVGGSEDRYECYTRDNVNTTWYGTGVYTTNTSILGLSHPYTRQISGGSQMMSNQTNTSASRIYVRLRGWEDEVGECAPFCGGNSGLVCDGCNGDWQCISDQDDACCDNTIYSYLIKNTTICDWTQFGEYECSNGKWGVYWQSRWNYYRGNTQGAYLDLGEIRPCASRTFNNSNKCYYGNSYTARTGIDVFYRITLHGPMSLNINTCGSSYDTYLYLLNSGGTLIASNDDACGLASRIYTNTLPAGNYYVVVDGFTSTSIGNHILNISNNPSTGTTYKWVGSNSTNWYDACNWDRNSVPTTTSVVTIPGSNIAPTQPTIGSGAAQCYDITIDSDNGGLLTISGTGTLNINRP